MRSLCWQADPDSSSSPPLRDAKPDDQLTRKTKTPRPSTPKRAATNARSPGGPTPAGRSNTGRYSPPVTPELPGSPWWLPVLIIVLLVGGVVICMTSYFGLPASGARTVYLVLGGAFVLAGFVAATRYR
jgi:hypothetical protein